MGFTRLPKFKRFTKAQNIVLTKRDRTIIQLVHRHRFLRSTQIAALLDCPTPSLLRRLQLLYHHGYLERPRAQLDYYHRGGSSPIVYGLGNKGGNLLRQELGESFRSLSWGEKNRAVGRIFLEHALLVSEVMVALELACRQHRNVRLLWDKDLHGGKPFSWKVRLNGSVQLGVIPDRTFVLEFQDADGNQQRVLYFLEADQGTMPVIRRNLAQTSMYRKILAYQATWEQNLHSTTFGFDRFRVVTITKSPARVASLMEACTQLVCGYGLFLFSDRCILETSNSILTIPFRTGKPSIKSNLLE